MKLGKLTLFGTKLVPDIDDPRKTNLKRWILVKHKRIGGIYLQRMEGGDQIDMLHDHGYRFVSLIWGGYWEEFGYNVTKSHFAYKATNVREVRWYNTNRGPGDYHSILRLTRQPTWTLLFRGPNVRNADGTSYKWTFKRKDGSVFQWKGSQEKREVEIAMLKRAKMGEGNAAD